MERELPGTAACMWGGVSSAVPVFILQSRLAMQGRADCRCLVNTWMEDNSILMLYSMKENDLITIYIMYWNEHHYGVVLHNDATASCIWNCTVTSWDLLLGGLEYVCKLISCWSIS